MRWFRALMPREEKFFDLFARHSDVVVAGAKALREMLEGGDAVPRHYKTVMDREHDADDITREVLIAVRRTFITPFDRGDVKNLITSHGQRHRPDAEDRQDHHAVRPAHVHAATEADGRRHHDRGRPGAGGDAAALVDQHQCRPDQPNQRTDFANRRAGRRPPRQRLQELYRANQPSNSMSFFIGVEIYDHLEKVVDRFDDVANEIHGIVLENV